MARQKTSRFPFTTARLRDLPAPAKGRVYHHDARTPGLTLCVTAKGSRTWYFVKWVAGRSTRVRLGKFPELGLDAARDVARELTGDVARGKDPHAERRARSEAPTLRDLFDHWSAHRGKRKKTYPDDVRQFEKYLRPWHGRRLDTIDKAAVQAWHSRMGEQHGPVMANRTRALLSAMYGVAADLGYDGPNPCNGVPKFRETSRERFLQPAELRRFFEALAAEEPLWRDLFLICLFTGARRGNVAGMEWAEIDLDRGVWFLPGEKTKNGEPMVVVLPEPALVVLRARQRTANGHRWVFPVKSASGHVEDPRKAWDRVLRRSGIVDLRMHDLRRSLGSWQAAAGASLSIIGASLGHRDPKATAVYARLQLDPVRASVEQATRAMLAEGELKLEYHEEGPDDGP